VAIVAAFVLSLVGGGATATFWLTAAARVVFSLVFAIVGSLLLMRILPSLPVGRKLVLQDKLSATDGYASAPESDRLLLGRTGHAHSPLRPAGIADIDGERVDVVADGEHIDAGAPIRVTRVDGNRVVVRRIFNINEKE
jgi:membrane-bound serine protease (ClpP class)